MVESKDLQELPEKGEVVYINKAGQRFKFVDGNPPGKFKPPTNEDETVSVV